MSETRKGKPFSDDEYKKYLAREEWRPAAYAFFKPAPDKRRIMEWRRTNKNPSLGHDWEAKAQTINELHGVDFLNVIIPDIIERIRSGGSKRKIKILDIK